MLKPLASESSRELTGQSQRERLGSEIQPIRVPVCCVVFNIHGLGLSIGKFDYPSRPIPDQRASCVLSIKLDSFSLIETTNTLLPLRLLKHRGTMEHREICRNLYNKVRRRQTNGYCLARCNKNGRFAARKLAIIIIIIIIVDDSWKPI